MLTPIMRPILQPVLVPVDYEYGDGINPMSIFAGGEQGFWYDPSDFSTMFQDAAGTTPVTAVGQPVGLMLDKRLGLALGSEKSTYSSGFTSISGISGVGATVSVASNELTITSTSTDGSDRGEVPLSGLTIGTTYAVTIIARRGAQGTGQQTFNWTVGSVPATIIAGPTNQTVSFVFVATAASGVARFYSQALYGSVGDSLIVSSLSVRELSGNHATQSTALRRPVLPAVGARLRSDFTDDFITAPNVGAAELYVKTPYGSYRAADLSAGASRLPLNDATGIIARAGTLNDAQRNTIFAYFGGNKKYMVALSPDTTITYLRIYTGGATTPLLFVGANGATVEKNLSANADSSFDVSSDGLTAPVAVCWPESLINNTALTIFLCRNNQLTGSIPSLSANTALTNFALYNEQLTGSIPSLSTNTALTSFQCQDNQLTGWTGGTVSATLGDFQAQNNLLTQAAVDAILAAFVAAGRSTGTRILNLGGTGNATPSAAGLADKATLQSRGWTVTTN